MHRSALRLPPLILSSQSPIPNPAPSMSSVDTTFAQLRAAGRKAFMPFVTAGDPDLDFTAEVIRRLAEQGCSLFELGIPYSDPIADGPVIQASFTRRGAQDSSGRHAGDDEPRRPKAAAPVVTMLSYSIRLAARAGVLRGRRQAAGIAGAIVPDLPVEEAGPLAEICRPGGFFAHPTDHAADATRPGATHR